MHWPLWLRLLLFSCFILVNSCTPLQAPRPGPPAQLQGPALTAAFAALPTSLAPYEQRSWHRNQVLALVYEGLTTLDKRLQPLPALAARWDISADGLVYTLHLRRGVQFHHGKELDAADVRYSFLQAATVTTPQQEESAPFAFIAAIQTPDPHTVRFLLKQPYTPFLSKLTVLSCPIVPDGVPSTAQAAPPGTGPFEVIRFQPGEAVVLKKFAAYWESDLPRLEKLMLRRVEGATARWQLLQRGEVDFVLLDPRYQHAPTPAANNNIVLVNSAPTGTFSLIFHTQRQPFSNANVRRALVLIQ